MDPFDSSDDDGDNILFTMMYQYYTNEMLQPDLTPLRTRRVMLNRDREAGAERIYRDYFVENCVYGSDEFERRFCLSRNVFLRIANTLENRYILFNFNTYPKINTNFYIIYMLGMNFSVEI